jgi:hypothetical protein
MKKRDRNVKRRERADTGMNLPNHSLFRKLEEERHLSLIRLKGKVPIENGWQKYCKYKRKYVEIGFMPDENAGIACGPASGTLVLDVDHPGKFFEICRKNNLKIPLTFTVQTGREKPHFHFQWPKNGMSYSNKSLADPLKEKGSDGKVIRIFDVRGEGGQVVAPGSIHPVTGKPYKITNDIPPAQAPTWFLEFIEGKIKLGGDYKFRPVVSDQIILQQEGPFWKWDGNIEILPISQRIRNFIKKGVPKGERSEAMMSVCNALVWANLSDQSIIEIFKKFPIGNKAREGGRGEKWLRKQFIKKARLFVRDRAQFRKRPEEDFYDSPIGWPEIQTGPQLEPLPPFPREAMPEVLGDMAEEITKSIQTPFEVAALTCLAVAGFCAGGHIRAKVKKHVWTRPNVYALIFLPRAERKSTVYKIALQAVETWIKEKSSGWAWYCDEKEIHESRVENLRKKISKTFSEESSEKLRMDLEREKEAKPFDLSPHFMVDDSTPEGLIKMLAETGGRGALFTDEGRQALQILTGLYSDKQVRDSLFLKSFDGEKAIDYRRSTGSPIRIENPVLGILIMVQNDWLEILGDRKELCHSGHNSRYFFCVPDGLAGKKDSHGNLIRRFTEYQISDDVEKRFSDLIHWLLDSSFKKTEIEWVDMEPKAKELWVDYFHKIESELGGALQEESDLAVRFPGLALKLALIHCLCRGVKTISTQDMRKAIILAEYFTLHAKRAWQIMNKITLAKNPRRILRHLKRYSEKKFTPGKIHQALRMGANEVRQAIEFLETKGYCKRDQCLDRKVGRPPEVYLTNPIIFGREFHV